MKAFILTLLLVGSACEQSAEINGEIIIPVEVQKLFSAENMGQVTVQGGAGTRIVYILCEPTSEPLTVPFQLYNLGCASEGSARAMVTPVSLNPQISNTRCGPFEGLGHVAPEPWLAFAKQPVFEGKDDGCGSGTENGVKLTLALVKQ